MKKEEMIDSLVCFWIINGLIAYYQVVTRGQDENFYSMTDFL